LPTPLDRQLLRDEDIRNFEYSVMVRHAIPGAQVVHTDDIAWWHSRFGWDDLMIEGVLAPLHAGCDVRYQPPAWAPRGRTGWVEASSAAPAVIIEGCGASR
jgi:hypothetical protein